MLISGDYTRAIPVKKITDSRSIRDSPYSKINGRMSSSSKKTRINDSLIIQRPIFNGDEYKGLEIQKISEFKKTATDFFSSSKKRSTSNERDLYSRYNGTSNSKELRPNSALRASSVIKSRIKKDPIYTDHSQELDTSHNNYSSGQMIHDRLYRQSSNGSNTFKSSSQNIQIDENGNTSHNQNKFENTHIFRNKIIDNRIEQNSNDILRSRQSSNIEHLSDMTNLGQEEQLVYLQKRPNHNQQIIISNKFGNTSNQENEKKKMLTGDERKKRIIALERYIEPKTSETELSKDFEHEKRSNDQQNILPPQGQQNFRRNLYIKNHNAYSQAYSSNSELDRSENDKIESNIVNITNNHNSFIQSFDRSFDNIQPDEIDVEEIHYFFVNFHQKSKRFLSKIN